MVEVREATLDDVPAAVALHAAVAAEGVWIGTEVPVDVERFERVFAGSVESPGSLFLVAVDAGSVVGLLSLHPVAPGLLGLGMSVDVDHRGQGVGTALLESAIAWARGQGTIHKIELEVWPHNEAGLRLYARTGFVVEGRRRRHYRRRSGELWDAIAMGLVLDENSPGSPHADLMAGGGG